MLFGGCPGGPSSHVVAFGFRQRADPFAEQSDIERLLEDFAEAVLGQFLRSGLVFGGEPDDQVVS